jgi:vacuolar-type H+-ATPase subunit H
MKEAVAISIVAQGEKKASRTLSDGEDEGSPTEAFVREVNHLNP